jgi:parallel beta-helix repeat protein
MRKAMFGTLAVLLLGIGCTLILLVALGDTKEVAIYAQGSDGVDTYYVAPGSNCNGASPCYGTVQEALDDVDDPNDVIKVAAGTYTDLHTRPRDDFVATGVVTQVAYISQTVTIQGGYTNTNWATPFPITQPVTLDAQNQGRVVYVTGDITVTLEGLRMTGGNAVWLGGRDGGNDAGGGLYAITATIALSRCWVYSNTVLEPGSGPTPSGGGIYFDGNSFTLRASEIYSNQAAYGGGLYVAAVSAALSDNAIYGNTAVGSFFAQGGGVSLSGDAATLSDNSIRGNAVVGWYEGSGGGVWAYSNSALTLNRNVILDNTAVSQNPTFFPGGPSSGGGLRLWGNDVVLVNNIVAGNEATIGSGLDTGASTAQLLHTTIAQNSGGSGVSVRGGSATLTNTILVSHSVGITVTAGNTVFMEGTLWYGNGVNWDGAGKMDQSAGYVGNPAFLDPGSGNYHVDSGSAAIDKGIDAGIPTDIDGDGRPLGTGPDLGADESPSAATSACYAQISSSPGLTYLAVQAAVDAASNGDLVKIAGYCSDIGARPRVDLYSSGVVTQVAYISKTLTLQGGYTTTNWITPDAESNPTMLDAQGKGRVIYITGDISVTVEGLRITGGSADDLGGYGPPPLTLYHHVGSGIYAITATVTVSNNWVFANVGNYSYGYGGGIGLVNCASAILENNTVYSNTSSYAGGGVYSRYGNATISGNTVYSNTSRGVYGSTGGGLNVSEGDTVVGNLVYLNTSASGGGIAASGSVTISGNTIYSNTATEGNWGGLAVGGGGLLLYSGDALVSGNTVYANVAADTSGGGLYLYESDATISNNTVYSNTVQDGSGGGFYLFDSDATLRDNTISLNTAYSIYGDANGGGLCIYTTSSAKLGGNVVASNTADYGGGLYLAWSDITLTNTVVTDNDANVAGDGLYIHECSPSLVHTTLARNGDNNSIGLYIDDDGWQQSHVTLTNTILVSHTVGITVTAGNTATLESTLWYGNDTNWGGAGTTSRNNDYFGDPAFAPDGYHLSGVSAAVDKGIDASVPTDIDGQARDAQPDLGADEYIATIDLTPPTFPDNDPLTGSPLITPTLGITVTVRRPVFDWKDAVDDDAVVSYTLVLTGSSPFSGVITAQDATALVTTTESIFTPTVDLPDAVYTWTVRAHDASGNMSDWAQPDSFTVYVPNRIYLPLVLRQFP